MAIDYKKFLTGVSTTEKKKIDYSKFLPKKFLPKIDPTDLDAQFKQRQQAELDKSFAKFGIAPQPLGDISPAKTTQVFGGKARLESYYGKETITPRGRIDYEKIAERDNIERYDKEGILQAEIDHIMSKALGGTDTDINLKTELALRELSDIKNKIPSNELEHYKRQSGRLPSELKIIEQYQNKEISQVEALKMMGDLKKTDMPSAFQLAFKDVGSKLANILRPLDFLHRTGLQITTGISMPISATVVSAAKLLGDKDLKDVSYDKIWKDEIGKYTDRALRIGAPTEAFKAQPQRVDLITPFVEKSVQKYREANEAINRGDEEGAEQQIQAAAEIGFYKFSQDWANPFYLFSLRGFKEGSFKLQPKEKVLSHIEINPAKREFLFKSGKTKIKGKVKADPTIKQITGRETVKIKYKPFKKVYTVNSSMKPEIIDISKGKVKPINPNIKIYEELTKNGTLKRTITNSGGEIFNKNLIRFVRDYAKPEFIKTLPSGAKGVAPIIPKGVITKVSPTPVSPIKTGIVGAAVVKPIIPTKVPTKPITPEVKPVEPTITPPVKPQEAVREALEPIYKEANKVEVFDINQYTDDTSIIKEIKKRETLFRQENDMMADKKLYGIGMAEINGNKFFSEGKFKYEMAQQAKNYIKFTENALYDSDLEYKALVDKLDLINAKNINNDIDLDKIIFNTRKEIKTYEQNETIAKEVAKIEENAKVSTQKEAIKEVELEVKKTELPVKEIPTKVQEKIETEKAFSTHYEKIKQIHKEITGESIDIGKQTEKNELRRARDYIQRNPQGAIQVAYGLKESSINKQVLSNAVFASLMASGKTDLANEVARKMSMRLTESARNLSFAKMNLAPMDQSRVEQNITKKRLEKLGEKLGETDPEKKIERAKREVKEKNKENTKKVIEKQAKTTETKMSELDELINKLLC